MDCRGLASQLDERPLSLLKAADIAAERLRASPITVDFEPLPTSIALDIRSLLFNPRACEQSLVANEAWVDSRAILAAAINVHSARIRSIPFCKFHETLLKENS